LKKIDFKAPFDEKTVDFQCQFDGWT